MFAFFVNIYESVNDFQLHLDAVGSSNFWVIYKLNKEKTFFLRKIIENLQFNESIK